MVWSSGVGSTATKKSVCCNNQPTYSSASERHAEGPGHQVNRALDTKEPSDLSQKPETSLIIIWTINITLSFTREPAVERNVSLKGTYTVFILSAAKKTLLFSLFYSNFLLYLSETVLLFYTYPHSNYCVGMSRFRHSFSKRVLPIISMTWCDVPSFFTTVFITFWCHLVAIERHYFRPSAVSSFLECNRRV